jgi:hypothetical protein
VVHPERRNSGLANFSMLMDGRMMLSTHISIGGYPQFEKANLKALKMEDENDFYGRYDNIKAANVPLLKQERY